MKHWLISTAVATIAGFVLVLPVAALADDGEHDQDRARELYEHGEIHSLYRILQQVRAQVDGDVVSVDLVHQGDKWVYRIQIVARDGRRSILDIDASADTPLENEGDD